MTRKIAPALLLLSVAAIGAGLAGWKHRSIQSAHAAAAQQGEPASLVTAAVARAHQHRATTTAIGTVVALRSVTLKNEMPGTVRVSQLVPGQIVEAGSVLVALDVSVEEAELQALQAQANLARTTLERLERLRATDAVSPIDVDRARAERDVALAQIARIQAVMARKTIRAPFRARIGITDLQPGQYLNEGSQLATLHSVDDAVHVDFPLPQDVAATLARGDRVEVVADGASIAAGIVAIDSHVDPATRNMTLRARIQGATRVPAPGASVRVKVAVGAPAAAVAVPASALRKGPAGDHVFVLAADGDKLRAKQRAVRAGAMLGDEVLIVSGLEAGERVAAAGSFKLRDAALVVVEGGDGAAPLRTASNT